MSNGAANKRKNNNHKKTKIKKMYVFFGTLRTKKWGQCALQQRLQAPSAPHKRHRIDKNQ